jgi:predicted  nucleic acid-binding Zn-ribbon protein
MDFLYSQLPEIVYNPADFTGISSSGTISLNIDNDKKIIDANIRGKLTIIDNNNQDASGGKLTYVYTGADDVLVNIPKIEKDNLKIESFMITSNHLENIEELKEYDVGDTCLKIYTESDPDNPTYVVIPTPMVSSDIQRITSINKIYSDAFDGEGLPEDAPVGSIYPFQKCGELILYEKTSTGYVEKSNVDVGGIYAILDTGLLAIASTKFSFKILNGALTALANRKQDNLVFEDEYNVETNRVATKKTVTDAIDTALTTAINHTDTEIEKLNNQLSESLEENFTEHSNKITSLEENLTEANNNIGSLSSIVTGNITNISTLGTTINSIENEISNLKTQILDTTNDNSVLSKIDQVTSEIFELSNDFTGYNNDLNTIKGNLNTISSDLNTVRSDLNTVSNNLSGRIATLESDTIVQIQKELEKL